MGSDVLSLRLDGELLDRIREHAAKRGMSVQDYVIRTLMRDDFDERFRTAVDATARFYGGETPTGRIPPPARIPPPMEGTDGLPGSRDRRRDHETPRASSIGPSRK
ncbi:hypothetical protein ACFYYR_16735 [Streptomyces sp. NPDC001922]|uniref:hypothetical protein n=1 Tax=Streptomyces sp. NPDC001922 TaxID=3364624 RepID=UPI00369D11BA